MSTSIEPAPPESVETEDSAEPLWPRPSALAAEFLGTLILVFAGVGVAVFARQSVGALGIALSFGFALMALVYAIGAVSGCHVNPAVTLAMVLAGRMKPLVALPYWVAQFAGGLCAAALLAWIANSVPILKQLGRGPFGSDGYGANSAVRLTMGGAFLVETLLTALLIFVVLGTTHISAIKGFDGLPIGVALAVVHLIGIPLTGTSVNPARALGPAVFADNNAMSQVWVFIVAPLVGALVGALAHVATHGLPPALFPGKGGRGGDGGGEAVSPPGAFGTPEETAPGTPEAAPDTKPSDPSRR